MKLQAIMPLLGAAMTIAVCYSAGALLMARLKIALRRAEKLPLAIILGAACVQLALYAIFAARLVYKPLLLGLSAAVIGAAILEHRRRRSLSARPAREFRWPENLPAFGYVMLFAVFTIFYFVNAWAPESSPDGSSYHLGLIAKYLRVHGFERVATNMYSGLGQASSSSTRWRSSWAGIRPRRWCTSASPSRWCSRSSPTECASANGG